MLTATWDESSRSLRIRDGGMKKEVTAHNIGSSYEVFGVEVSGTEICVLVGVKGASNPHLRKTFNQRGFPTGSRSV